ncbi:ABC transporter ATP-binding protein [Deferribacterales bacterium RsTz2092]|nr:ABC transporter ATP-binding protein [Deferribacterales bacterium]
MDAFSANSIIVAEDVSITYDGRIAVSNVNLSVDAGDYLCIIGENGSGKSTLMKGLLGIVNLADGCVRLTCLQRSQIGYLPQRTPAQRDFPASVFEIVLSGRLNRQGVLSFYTDEDRAQVRENLAYLQVDELADEPYRNLSGGQKQRVLLARALCASERVLMLDEPVAGLDPIMTGELQMLLDKLNKERKLTIVMISHDVVSAVRCANKILHMHKSPLFFGKTADYVETDIYKKLVACIHV